MARLPTPGSDSGMWGTILNDFLTQTLNSEGKLKDNIVTANTIAPNSVTNSALATNAVNATIIADGSITESLLDQTLKDKVNALTGGAVTSVAGKTGVVTLTKSDVGLSNVDNTSDADKPVSSATQTALADKLDKSTSINQIYGTDGSGGQTTYSVQQGAAGVNTIPRRTGSGAIFTANPTDSSHAATKGYVDTSVSDLVTLTSEQTLSNKTLNTPRINSLFDTNGNTALDLGAIPNAVNRIYIDNQSTGNYPTIGATGPDNDIGIALSPKNGGRINVFGNAPTIAAAGGANGGNLNLDLRSQGTGTVLANGLPISTSKVNNPFYTDPNRFEPWPQMMNNGGNWTLTSGDMPMTLFTPATNLTVSNIITMAWLDSEQTDATECKVAVYRVDDLTPTPANMTCIARSANKSDRWNGPGLDVAPIVDDGAVSPSPISSITLNAGQQYAVAYMSVGHTGSAKLNALSLYRIKDLQPHLGYFGGGGYTDMPVNLNWSWAEEWTHIWFALT